MEGIILPIVITLSGYMIFYYYMITFHNKNQDKPTQNTPKLHIKKSIS